MADRTADYGLRFGLRSLIVWTAAFAALFALVNLTSPLAGLAIGLGISFGGFLLVVVAAMVLRGCWGPDCGQRPTFRVLERASGVLVLAASLLSVALIFAGGAQVLVSILGRRADEASWNRELGFTHRQVQVYRDGEIRHYLAVESVEPGGPFEASGIRQDETIVMDRRGFFELVRRNRGQSVSLTVASGGASGQWKDFVSREVTLDVPE